VQSEGHPASKKNTLQKPLMSHKQQKTIPARTAPGQTQTRSALPLPVPGRSDKLAKGTRVRVGTANVGTMEGKSGEIVHMVNRSGWTFSVAGNEMEGWV